MSMALASLVRVVTHKTPLLGNLQAKLCQIWRKNSYPPYLQAIVGAFQSFHFWNWTECVSFSLTNLTCRVQNVKTLQVVLVKSIPKDFKLYIPIVNTTVLFWIL